MNRNHISLPTSASTVQLQLNDKLPILIPAIYCSSLVKSAVISSDYNQFVESVQIIQIAPKGNLL